MNRTDGQGLGHENLYFEQCCIVLPNKINSNGIWKNKNFLTYPMPNLELVMLIVFMVFHAIFYILKPLGISSLASQMIVGIILGPVVLGHLKQFKSTMLPSADIVEVNETISMFGFIIFLFLMGIKVDLKAAFKSTKTAMAIGILSLVSPIVISIIIHSVYFDRHNLPDDVKVERVTEAIIESVTCFSVIACLLKELNIINSELGKLALSSAIVGDLCSILLFICMNFYKIWSISPITTAVYAIAMAFFIFLLIFVFRPWMQWIIKETPQGRPINEFYIFAIILLALGSSLYTYMLNQTPLFGPFLFGLAVPDGPPLGSALIDKFECFVSGAFLPLYISISTMKVNPRVMFCDMKITKFSIFVVVSTFLSKFIACLIPSFWSKMPWKDSVAFALIMTSKGIIELLNFSVAFDEKIVTETTFVVGVIGILLNSTIVPILVKTLYNTDSKKYAGYQRRNMMHLKSNTELRILACVHRPENVPAFIDLLDVIHPTKESPNIVYVLHLIELIGRASPIFIAHKKQEKKVVSSYEDFILAFNQYEQKSWGLVTVNAFTAISPCNLMHEDICNLALNKQTNFILLPFHKKWSIDGSIEVEYKMIRNLNCSVLERSPCSIGILVDRGNVDRRITRTSLQSPMTKYNIAMIFIGGKDDREALTLATRMANDPSVSLTVIHLVAEEIKHVTKKDMIDSKVLSVNLKNIGNGNIMYVEEVVKDGPQSALIVRSISNQYDLIIVGRRNELDSIQTSGLSEWSEFPELGIIGDILASPNLDSRASVLVVQQQQYVKED